MKNRFQKGGFTLIELLIVMSVLGILATGLVLLLNPNTQFQKARDAKRKSELQQITTFLNTYYQDNNRYPPAGSCAYGAVNCYVFSTDGKSWIPALVPNYTNELPIDPKNNANNPWIMGNYSYAYGNVSSDGQHYDLFTQLEYNQDSQRCGINNYLYEIGISPPGISWCTAYGGSYSNQIYAVDQ